MHISVCIKVHTLLSYSTEKYVTTWHGKGRCVLHYYKLNMWLFFNLRKKQLYMMPVSHSMPSVCAIIQYSILKCLKALSFRCVFQP